MTPSSTQSVGSLDWCDDPERLVFVAERLQESEVLSSLTGLLYFFERPERYATLAQQILRQRHTLAITTNPKKP